jgi:hypothetical protein
VKVSEQLWVDTKHRLRWGRRPTNYLTLMYSGFSFAKTIRPGSGVAVGYGAIYRVRWEEGRISDTLTIMPIDRL